MLTPNLYKGYRVPNFTHTYNPLMLVRSLFESFKKNGGKFIQESVKGFEIGSKKVQKIF